MKSINFNEGGRFLTFAWNYMNLALYVALLIPYPRYGVNPRSDSNKREWHLGAYPIRLVIYKTATTGKEAG